MLSILFLIILGLGAYGLYRYFNGQQQRRLEIRASLATAAQALSGEIEQREHARKQRVVFSEQGHNFALSREKAPSDDTNMQDMFVVEVLQAGDNLTKLNLKFDLRRASTFLPSLVNDDDKAQSPAITDPVVTSPGGGFDFSGDDESHAIFLRIIENTDNKRLLDYALDHKDARLHFSPQGVWFDCAGFSENGELVAATARTAARALAIFLSDHIK